MDTIANVRTFLIAARLGSFAAAARALSIAPSVVSKRIGQIEHDSGVTLFHRSTRKLELTVDGNRLLPRCMKIVADFDDLRNVEPGQEIRGHLRVDAPGTVTSRILGPIFCDFLLKYPGIDMELRLIDRLDNPLEQGCDLAIGTRPSTFEQIHDFPLMPYPCAAYASPAYLRDHGQPEHPHDLSGHNCLVSLLYGTIWHFYGDAGDYAVTVSARMSVNDTIVLREAARHDLGIAVMPTYLLEGDVRAGRLIPVLTDFRLPPLWLKALVPNRNAVKPSVAALLTFLRERLAIHDREVGPGRLAGQSPPAPFPPETAAAPRNGTIAVALDRPIR